MSYYKNWSPQENIITQKKILIFNQIQMEEVKELIQNFQALMIRVDGQHYFTMYIKFGQGRTMNDACRDIRDDFIDRNEALLLMQKYDGEFPRKYFKEFLDYINISEEKYWTIIDKARPPHLWRKKNGKWF